MNLKEQGIYHIYNRGNSQQQIFFSDDNYKYFLTKCQLYLKPNCDILAWCLLPNHFHFLISVNEKSLHPIKIGGLIMPTLSNGFRLLQSSYAKGINIQRHRTGNLFQQKTKSKLVSGELNYSLMAFDYVHLNPKVAGLVAHLEDWPYSSFRDYAGLRNGTLCNKQLAFSTLGLSDFDFKLGFKGDNINNDYFGKIL
jgi:REP element-mobilizing transposase RayT